MPPGKTLSYPRAIARNGFANSVSKPSRSESPLANRACDPFVDRGDERPIGPPIPQSTRNTWNNAPSFSVCSVCSVVMTTMRSSCALHDSSIERIFERFDHLVGFRATDDRLLEILELKDLVRHLVIDPPVDLHFVGFFMIAMNLSALDFGR